MRILHKHLLPFDNAFAFYSEALEGTNAFSGEILTIVSREKGQFFTLLPDKVNLDQLYQFKGSILPAEPKKRGKVGNLPGTHIYSLIPSMEEEFAAFLYKQMQTHAYQFISDDYNAAYKEVQNKEWFNLYGMHYLEEIYYFLSQQDATPQLIEECLSRSKTFWHALSILSEKSVLEHEEKTLQLRDIQAFCKFAKFVLVGAYDGEGYVVWERE
jgi:hypothetical protein